MRSLIKYSPSTNQQKIEYKGKKFRLALSPTKLVAWNGCKTNFKNLILKEKPQEQNIYAANGIAAHSMIERLNKGEVFTKNELLYQYKMALINECMKENVPVNFGIKGFQETRESLQDYKVPDGWVFDRGEHLVTLEFDLFTFRYKVDALFLDQKKKHIYIVDYKTNARVPSDPTQMLAYAWCEAIQSFDYIMDGWQIIPVFWMLRDHSLKFCDYGVPALIDMQDRIMRNVDLMVKCFELDYFTKEPSRNICGYCPLQNDCEAKDV